MLVAACAAVPVQKRLLPLLARPASASACPPGATFVSLVSNESYVPGALCLVRAMRKLGGTCPFLLLLDDLPAPPGAHVALSAASTSSLAQAYGGRTQLLPLSALQARLVAHTHNASGAGHRRRLRTLHPTGWVQNTHRKLLLWALPGFSKVVFLDIDILIVANVDRLAPCRTRASPRDKLARAHHVRWFRTQEACGNRQPRPRGVHPVSRPRRNPSGACCSRALRRWRRWRAKTSAAWLRRRSGRSPRRDAECTPARTDATSGARCASPCRPTSS